MPSSKKFSIPAFQCQVLERCGISTCGCPEQDNPSTCRRRWNSATHNCSQPSNGEHSMQFQRFGPDRWGNQERSYTQVADALHFRWMALWAKAASIEAPCLSELLGRPVHQRRNCNQGFQSSHTFHSVKESLAANTWRTPRSGKMYAESQRVRVLAWNKWWHPRSCGKMWNLPIKFKSSQADWKCQQSSTTTSGTPWEQICFIGTGLTSLWLVTTLPNSSSSGNFQTVPHMLW